MSRSLTLLRIRKPYASQNHRKSCRYRQQLTFAENEAGVNTDKNA